MRFLTLPYSTVDEHKHKNINGPHRCSKDEQSFPLTHVDERGSNQREAHTGHRGARYRTPHHTPGLRQLNQHMFRARVRWGVKVHFKHTVNGRKARFNERNNFYNRLLTVLLLLTGRAWGQSESCIAWGMLFIEPIRNARGRGFPQFPMFGKSCVLNGNGKTKLRFSSRPVMRYLHTHLHFCSYLWCLKSVMLVVWNRIQ